MWQMQGDGFSNTWIIHALKLRLTDMSKQEIMSNVWSNRICVNYRIIKNEILFEKYLVKLNRRGSITLCRFRCRSHRLPINNGRFENNPEESKIECPCCDLKVFGDEFHYVFVCPFFKKERQLYLDRQFVVSNPSTFHMDKLFNRSSVKQLRKLVKFIRVIIQFFSLVPKAERHGPIFVSKSVVTRCGRQTKPRDILDL